MERSEEEAKLINMLEIGAIVETYDKRFGTSLAKALQPSKTVEIQIGREAENKQVKNQRSRTIPRDETSISNSQMKISSNEDFLFMTPLPLLKLETK